MQKLSRAYLKIKMNYYNVDIIKNAEVHLLMLRNDKQRIDWHR